MKGRVGLALGLAGFVGLISEANAQSPRIDTLMAILRPVLPYPSADENGDLPVGGSAESKWFVIWPSRDDARIVVRANPLHRDTQAAAAEAMGRIQEAVVAAERKAQAEYDRALEELRRTGKGTDLDGISLDDEGVAGERIDAELELTIELDAAPASFEIATASEPSVTVTTSGAQVVVQIAANTYRDTTTGGARQRFRPAEARIFVGMSARPTIARRDTNRFAVTLPAPVSGFAVILRGNETLLHSVLSTANWARLRP